MKNKGFCKVVAFFLVMLCLFSCSDSPESAIKYPTPTLKGIVEIPAEAGIRPTDVKVTVKGVDGVFPVAADGSWMISNLEEGKTYDVYFSANVAKNASTRDINLLDDDDDDDDDYWGDRIEDAVAQYGQEIMEYIATLTRAWTVKGNVTLKDQDNHSGIMVYIPGTQFIAMTDAAGNYAIKGIPEGKNYEVAFAKQDWMTETSPKFNLAGNTLKRVVNLEPVELSYYYGKIAGNLTFENPKANVIGKWSVYAFNDENGATAYYPVLEDGSYVIGRLKEGIYNVYLIDGNGTSFIVDNVKVEGGKVATANFVIPDFVSSITGKLTADPAIDYSAANITLVSHGKIVRGNVAADGSFKIPVDPGAWEWIITLNGYKTLRGNVEVGNGPCNLENLLLEATGAQSSVVVEGDVRLLLEGNVLIPWYIEISINGENTDASIFSIDFNKGGFGPRTVNYSKPTTLTCTINDKYASDGYYINFYPETVTENGSEYTLLHCILDNDFTGEDVGELKVSYDYQFEIHDGDFIGVWIDNYSSNGYSYDRKGLIPLYNDKTTRNIKVLAGRYGMNGNNVRGSYPSVSPKEYRRERFDVAKDQVLPLSLNECEATVTIEIPGFKGNGLLVWDAKSNQYWPPMGGGKRYRRAFSDFAELGAYDIAFYPEDNKNIKYVASCDLKDIQEVKITLQETNMKPELRLTSYGKYYKSGDDIKFTSTAIGVSNPRYEWSLDGVVDEEQTSDTYLISKNALASGGHRIELKLYDGSLLVDSDHRDIVINPVKTQKVELSGKTYLHYRQDVLNQLGTVVRLSTGNEFRNWGSYEQTVEGNESLTASVKNDTSLKYTYYLVAYDINDEHHVDVVLDREIANPAYVTVSACDMYNPNEDGQRGLWMIKDNKASGVSDYLGFPILSSYDTRTFKVEEGSYHYTGNWGGGGHYVQYRLDNDFYAVGGNTENVCVEIDY